ncbi:MAG: tRNA-(ms[2]io[6]A)-hydroxylase [Acidobacteriota bacterium]
MDDAQHRFLEGLPLVRPTDPRWARRALGDLDALLADHAHCEHKAASTALALIGRHGDLPELVRPLMALAQEELLHFRQVLDLLEARGAALGRPRPDRYVRALLDRCLREPGGIGALGDRLLVCALVEARSCERFRRLAAVLAQDAKAGAPELGAFYGRLATAEGRHWELFERLARRAAPASRVAGRLGQFVRIEAEIVGDLPIEARIH